jgi:uncharacterized protein YjiS (DUF1127 family)
MKTLFRHLRALGHELAGIWRYARARDELASLPDAILRDLAIDRSEFASLLAESRQRVDRTRRRIANAM